MTDNVSRRIDAVARRSNEARQRAEFTFARAMEARRAVLVPLFEAAKDIQRKHGATLEGHPFCFIGPDAAPKHDAAIGVFVARVFEASFDGCPGNSTFGLNLEIDHYQQVTSCYLGAAALEDTRDIIRAFVAWLEEMWLCFPPEAMTPEAVSTLDPVVADA
jgi:hypothetical protein